MQTHPIVDSFLGNTGSYAVGNAISNNTISSGLTDLNSLCTSSTPRYEPISNTKIDYYNTNNTSSNVVPGSYTITLKGEEKIYMNNNQKTLVEINHMTEEIRKYRNFIRPTEQNNSENKDLISTRIDVSYERDMECNCMRIFFCAPGLSYESVAIHERFDNIEQKMYLDVMASYVGIKYYTYLAESILVNTNTYNRWDYDVDNGFLTIYLYEIEHEHPDFSKLS